MATITVNVQSFLNAADMLSISISDTNTVAQLKTAINGVEGVDTAIMDLYLNNVALVNANTLVSQNVVNNSYIKTSNKISTLATREARQVAKLELAALDRAAYGTRRSVYDITELPSKYSNNAVVDNSNPDGLLVGRPWVDISRTGLQLYLDPASTASYPGSGTSIYDLSTNAYTGTLLNGVGFANDALTFDGSNDYIDMNSTVTSDNFTVISWFKCSDVAAFRMIISKETAAGWPWNYRLYLQQTNGILSGDIATSAGGSSSVSSTTAYNDDAWHMAAFIRNTTDDKLYLFVDGVQVNQATDTTTTSIANAQEIWFGRSAYTAGGANPTGSYPYKGSLGEQMVYNRAMTADEIAITFRATRSRYGV